MALQKDFKVVVCMLHCIQTVLNDNIKDYILCYINVYSTYLIEALSPTFGSIPETEYFYRHTHRK